MGIHQDVRDGTLTEARLEKYLAADRNVLEEQDPADGLRPLGIATCVGNADEVLLLLKSGANADALSKDGESPLVLAASKTEKDRARIIQLLLSKSLSSVDVTSPSRPYNTPLMYVVEKKDVESIRLLVKARAKLGLTNDDGYDAKALADKGGDNRVIRALNPEKEMADLAGLVDIVVSLLLFIVAWVNKAADQVVRRMYGLNVDLQGEWDKLIRGTEDLTTAQFEKRVDEVVKNSPVERFFKDKRDFVQEFAQNVAELENDNEASLGSPDLLPKTISVSLHQQVIYCDDSSSMKREGRWESQANLVERIAKITTRVLPEKDGVALRFINKEVPDSLNLRLTGIKNILANSNYKEGSNTPIGTELKSKILKPLVYDKLDSVPKSLERPLLISVITDGGPEGESEPGEASKGPAVFIKAIKDCGTALEAAGYPRESVKFMIGQVGASEKARKFLIDIAQNKEIADMVHCTTERLDERFKKELENERQLDRWLIETLFEPLKDREKKLEK